jgi:general stress protein 26
VYLAAEGVAEIIKDKAAFEQHWTKDLDVWFEKGIDTPGLVLLKVRAHRIKVWKRTRSANWLSSSPQLLAICRQ